MFALSPPITTVQGRKVKNVADVSQNSHPTCFLLERMVALKHHLVSSANSGMRISGIISIVCTRSWRQGGSRSKRGNYINISVLFVRSF